LSEGAVHELGRQRWPGNVRELQNFVERLVVFTDGKEITEADVRRELDRFPRRSESQGRSGEVALEAAPEGAADGTKLATRRSEAEREAVLEALNRARGNRTQAARLLGVSRRTLYKRLGEFDLTGH